MPDVNTDFPPQLPVPAEEEPYIDPVIEAYKKDIDRAIILENLRLTPQQRLDNLVAITRDLEELRAAMIEAKAAQAR